MHHQAKLQISLQNVGGTKEGLHICEVGLYRAEPCKLNFMNFLGIFTTVMPGFGDLSSELDVHYKQTKVS